MSQGKIILMACGSFSPPTFMHLRMFEIAKDYIHSLGIGTIVGGIMSPVHDAYGKKDLVAAHHRIAMLKLALRSSGWIKVSEWETQQSGWTRTKLSIQYHQETINNYLSQLNINTTDAPAWLPDDVLNVNSIDEPDDLRQKLNGNIDDDTITIKLLCGADLLESFATPGLWSDEDIETIVGRHGLVVVSRAGSDPGRFIYESDMLYKHRKNVILMTNYITNEVSSTVIRRLLRRGESAKYLTDDAVLAYIRQNRLYGSLPCVTEYNILNEMIANYDKRSPQDITMTSPEETSFKNILISIRDKPSIIDETITVKRPKKSNFLLPSHTDCISPTMDPKPKIAYLDKVPSTYVPGKAVKIVSDVTKHALKDEKVSEITHSSLDSYLSRDEYDLYKRRVSEGNMEQATNVKVNKKRCTSSTIRKLRPEDMKKSKSEVSKLCDKMKSIKLKDSSRNYKTRSCNDIVKLILTKHGIHVISDTEAMV
ncbi:nicotinamide/nicotinic acid mononucleotide adenylyltransferase 1 isoform X1 [Maniola hyperantus]|uniref:nicotinamide/nicotinic acid mononucleotide adenylyltransferase 1 isoform X1 n=1 Tax=Aphantopus hyperantus TaxID=2795564 RepID=UPI0015697B4C|nr:nicotinamide/nicotinic acid mononucleotide adenylyltransferase 1 isoform X1 [Maniola hyperantus]